MANASGTKERISRPRRPIRRKGSSFTRTAIICGALVLGYAFVPFEGARATEPLECAGTDGWIIEAATFVEDVTGAPVPPPCIHFVSQRRLNSLISTDAGGQPHHGDTFAAFEPMTGQILLGHDFDPADPLDRSYLVHEIAHAQQFASGRHMTAPCVGRLEGDAYALQGRYLRERGLEDEAFLVQLIGMLQGACEYTY